MSGSATPIRHFRSLVFGQHLEILLESPEQRLKKGEADIAKQGSVTNIDYSVLKEFIKQKKGKIVLNTTLTIDLDLQQILVRGYTLGHNLFICCSFSNTIYRIPINFDLKILFTTLEYLYHVETCI